MEEFIVAEVLETHSLCPSRDMEELIVAEALESH
jgi:hypothetical protein